MTGKYFDIIKSSRAYASVERDIREGRESHAYLLLSPDALSLDILSALVVARSIDPQLSFLSHITAGSAADVIQLPLDPARKKILTEDIDYLTESAYVTPTQLKKKYYVLSYGETMNESCQNKLLKTLEEPPSVTEIIIKCANPSALLPTVVSRCRRAELEAFTPQQIEAELKKYYPVDEAFYLAAGLSRGLIGDADAIASDPHLRTVFAAVLDTLRYMKRSGDAAAYAYRLLAMKDDLPRALNFFELVLRDVAVAPSRPQLMLFRDVKGIRELAAEFPHEAVLGIMPAVARARRRLDLYGNPAGVVDELLLKILEEKAKCRK